MTKQPITIDGHTVTFTTSEQRRVEQVAVYGEAKVRANEQRVAAASARLAADRAARRAARVR